MNVSHLDHALTAKDFTALIVPIGCRTTHKQCHDGAYFFKKEVSPILIDKIQSVILKNATMQCENRKMLLKALTSTQFHHHGGIIMNSCSL